MSSMDDEPDTEHAHLIQDRNAPRNRHACNRWSLRILGLVSSALLGLVLWLDGIPFGSASGSDRKRHTLTNEVPGIVMFAETEQIVCDDSTALKANGCCSNDKCPSNCNSKSESSSNGVAKCQCQQCPAPIPSKQVQNVSAPSVGGVDEEGPCDDFTPLNANGCCSNDKCPRNCHSKSVSPSNGVTTCQCQQCVAPRSDEEACMEDDDDDDDDDRRLRSDDGLRMRNGGNTMRNVSKQMKFVNCMIGRAILKGQLELQRQLKIPKGKAQGLELLGLLASGAIANASAAAGPKARRLFNLGASVTAVGNFFQKQGQAAIDAVKNFATSFANIDQYFCPLLMPMCDCKNPKTTPPSWAGGGFKSNCVLGPPFSQKPLEKYVKTFGKGNVVGTLTSDIFTDGSFSLELGKHGDLTLSIEGAVKGNLSLDAHLGGDLELYSETVQFGSLNKTSCFLVNGFPTCIGVMLLFSATIDAKGIFLGDVRPSFGVDAAFDAEFTVPFPFAQVTTTINKNRGRFNEGFEMKLNMQGAGLKLTLAPELSIFPLPGLPVGIGTYMSAEILGTAGLAANLTLWQDQVSGSWKSGASPLTSALSPYKKEKGIGLNILWESEGTAASLPDMTLKYVHGSMMDFLKQMVEGSIEELHDRIKDVAAENVIASLRSIVETFLDMLARGAKLVLDKLFDKLAAMLPIFDHLPAGWQYKPEPHMCIPHSWGTFSGKSTQTCPLAP